MRQSKETARTLCRFDGIPQCRGKTGLIYYTFSVGLVNRAGKSGYCRPLASSRISYWLVGHPNRCDGI